jgi:hypothetical protein
VLRAAFCESNAAVLGNAVDQLATASGATPWCWATPQTCYTFLFGGEAAGCCRAGYVTISYVYLHNCGLMASDRWCDYMYLPSIVLYTDRTSSSPINVISVSLINQPFCVLLQSLEHAPPYNACQCRRFGCCARPSIAFLIYQQSWRE